MQIFLGDFFLGGFFSFFSSLFSFCFFLSVVFSLFTLSTLVPLLACGASGIVSCIRPILADRQSRPARSASPRATSLSFFPR